VQQKANPSFFENLPWGLIVFLAVIQLVRPVLSTMGVFDDIRPLGPIITTVIIALIWVSAAVFKKLESPVKVFMVSGVVYAVLSIVMAVFLQTAFDWSEDETVSIPVLLTAGLMGALATNIIWGGVLGLIAKLLIRLLPQNS